MPTHHQLLIMRHAKSSWAEPLPDHRRPLNKRGRRDGKAAGEWLAENIGALDRVCISTSVRTRLTWERAEVGGATTHKLSFKDELYGGTLDDYLRILRKLPENVGSALVLGHWPGVEDVVRSLATQDGHPGWVDMERKFPTSAIAVLDVPGTWAALEPGGTTLVEYVVPRG